VAAGWLFGAAIAFQPLAIVLVPLVVASIGFRSAWQVVWRSAAPSVVLLVAPLVSAFGPTFHALVDQPNFANLDHRTPWTFLAPTVGGSGRDLLVAAGPMRTASVLGAVALAVVLRRKLADPAVLVWACAVALALRCVTESVMVAYYLWPALALTCLLLARKRLGVAAFGLSLVAFLTAFSDIRFGSWLWWPVSIGTLLVVLALATPPLKSGPVDDDHIVVVHSGASSPALESGIVSASRSLEAPRRRTAVFRVHSR
jgi:hypothetical protein